jgi:hypothetical protein
MKAKETKKMIALEPNLEEKYKTLDALFEEKEKQFLLYAKWKERIDEAMQRKDQSVRIKLLSIEEKKNQEVFAFLPGHNLKRQLLSGKFQIESIKDSTCTYLQEIQQELKTTYDAATKKDYRKLVNLFLETLPGDLLQIIELNATNLNEKDSIAKAIYIIQVEVKKKQYLEKLFEAEQEVIDSDRKSDLDDLRFALNNGKTPINAMTIILIDDLLKRIPGKTEELNTYKMLLAKICNVTPNTVTRYLDARLSCDPRNDPYKSQKSLEYALNFFDEIKNKELTEKIERHLNKLL